MNAPGGALNLQWSEHGYWYAGHAAPVSYPKEGNAACFSIEENSFWFRHRNEVICTAVRRFPPAGPVFDIGGGNGYVSLGLVEAGFAAVVVEPGRTGAANACRRGLRNVVCSTIEDAAFPEQSIDAIGLFDVLEHIPDDQAFLGSLRRLLRPGAKLYLTVPAFQWLWSRDDVHAGHYRRYTTRSLEATFRAAGFESEYLTYFFWFLPAPIFALRTFPGWLGLRREPTEAAARREHSADGRGGLLIRRALATELGRLRRGQAIPFGGSLLAVASRGR